MKSEPLFAQVKLHRYFGGGEVFASHLAEAAQMLGGSSVLIVGKGVRHWADLRTPSTRFVEVADWDEAAAHLPPNVPVIVHAPPPLDVARKIVAQGHSLVGFAHMPLDRFYTGGSEAYKLCRRVVGVSRYVMDTIRAVGLTPWEVPFYGVADVRRANDPLPIIRRSEFEWDRRKIRDRLLGYTEPLWSRLRSNGAYRKREGLTLGIVSRLAPIKQFPLLMSLLMPDLQRHKDIRIEIFGAGGYASVRDLRRALRPLTGCMRFWGHQRNVAQVYENIDILLTGLPEREALGLNVIEAQSCGVPVLAPGGAPFTETVIPGRTGWLFADPRRPDHAAPYPTFAEALAEVKTLHAAKALPDPRHATESMDRFSRHAFAQRLAELLASLR